MNILTDDYGHEVPLGEGPYRRLSEIKRANEQAGKFYFSRDTLAFFGARQEPEIYAGRFFVESVQPPHGPRLWCVRVAWDDGNVSSLHDTMEGSPDRATAVARAKDAALAVLGQVTR